MADGFGYASAPLPGNPVLAGLYGAFQQLPGAIQFFGQERRAQRLEEEYRQSKRAQTLAEIMKLPRNMRGPMLSQASKSFGVDPTLAATLQRADTQQSQDIVAMLQQAGAEDPAGLARLLETPDQAISVYNQPAKTRREREQQERTARILGPGSEGAGAPAAPEPETLGALVTPPPMAAPRGGPPRAALPPGGPMRLDVDPSIGPPGAVPGGGAPGVVPGPRPFGVDLGTLDVGTGTMAAAAAPAAEAGTLGELLTGPAGPALYGPGERAPRIDVPPLAAPRAPAAIPGPIGAAASPLAAGAAPGPLPPGAPPGAQAGAAVGAATGGAVAGLTARADAISAEIDRTNAQIQRLQAEGLYTENVDKGMSRRLDGLKARYEQVKDQINRVTPEYMEPREIVDEATGQPRLHLVDKRSGATRDIGDAPAKGVMTEVDTPDGPQRVLVDPATGRQIRTVGPVFQAATTPIGKLQQDLATAERQEGPDSPRVQELRQALATEQRAQGLGLRKTEADIVQSQAAAGASRAAAGLSLANTQKVQVDIAEGRRPKPSDIAGMRKEFTAQAKPFVEVRDAFERMRSASDTSQGDVARVYAYMKMLDPGSVVREGEFATAEQTTGLVPRATIGLYNRVVSGERLTPDQRKGFLAEAGKLYGAQLRSHRQLEGQYTSLARRAGVDPDDVVLDVVSTEAPSPAPRVGAPGAGPAPRPLAPGATVRPPAALPQGGVRIETPIPGLRTPAPASARPPPTLAEDEAVLRGALRR